MTPKIKAYQSILHNNVTKCTFLAGPIDEQTQIAHENHSHLEWMGDLRWPVLEIPQLKELKVRFEQQAEELRQAKEEADHWHGEGEHWFEEATRLADKLAKREAAYKANEEAYIQMHKEDKADLAAKEEALQGVIAEYEEIRDPYFNACYTITKLEASLAQARQEIERLKGKETKDDASSELVCQFCGSPDLNQAGRINFRLDNLYVYECMVCKKVTEFEG